MNIILYIFSDNVWLPLLELLIVLVFLRAIIYDIIALKCPGNPSKKVTRGEKGWGILLSFWALTIIIVEIIISSELIRDYKVIVGLVNLAILIYLNLFSSYFRNKIIGWTSWLQKIEEHH